MRITRPADEVWSVVGRPELLHHWFPGIVDCRVDGASRTIVTGTGQEMAEEILTNDAIQRRFQYRITSRLFRDHLGTIDVIDLGDDTCLVVYATDADPATMAITIAGGTRGALLELQRQMEAGSGPALDARDADAAVDRAEVA
ncbi:MAG: SRPBCC family protein [Acidimicrobiia bacterium]|nr:SRPBCC family protein [Acidimicrobiia bacterium]